MRWLKIDKKDKGGVSSETVVTIMTIDGEEVVVVHNSQVRENSLEVGVIGMARASGGDGNRYWLNCREKRCEENGASGLKKLTCSRPNSSGH
jgi:hypothetical protein